MPEASETQTTPESTPAPETTPSTPQNPESSKPAEKPTLFKGFDDPDKEDVKPDPRGKPEAPRGKPVDSPGIKNLREGHEKAQKEWREKESDYQRKIQEAEKRINELKARPERHPDDQKKLSEYEKKVAVADFKNSDEYEKSFRQPLNKTYQDSLNLAKRFPAIERTEDGETNRASSEQDFRTVMTAPPEQQAELAQKIYGPVNAARIITMIDRISDLYGRGEQEAMRRAEQYQSTLKEQSQKEQERNKALTDSRGKIRQDIESRMPDIYGEHEDDPESQKLIQEGRDYIEEFRSNRDTMTDAELAEREAVMEAAASAFPVMKHQRDSALSKVKELEEELAKYRQSDPGRGGNKTPPDPATDTSEKGVGGLLDPWKKYDKH